MLRVFCIAACLLLFNGFALSVCAKDDTEPKKENIVEVKKAWGAEVQGHAVSIMVKKTAFVPEEPIVLTITLKNVGIQDIRIVKWLPLVVYDIEVCGADGKKIPLTRYGKWQLDGDGESGRSLVTLKPGEEYSLDVHLSRMFDLTRSAEYTVSVQRVVGKSEDGSRLLKATSNKLTFKIAETLVAVPHA